MGSMIMLYLFYVAFQWETVNNKYNFMCSLVFQQTKKTKIPYGSHLPRACETKAAMALCSRSGLTAWTINSWGEQRAKGDG